MSEPGKRPELPRVMGLRDVVLFNITAIVGLRWLTTAASQFGLAALTVWVVAMLVFFIPSAIAVRELADIDPSSGGIYCWVDRAYGPRQAFVAGWLYCVNNLLYFPSLLVTTAAIAAYAGGPRTAALGNDPGFIRIVSLVGLWIAVWLNVVGLRVGKWLQNLGGIGTWIPALLFVLLAAWGFAARGSATPIHVSGLVPTRFDFPSINLFATMTFDHIAGADGKSARDLASSHGYSPARVRTDDGQPRPWGARCLRFQRITGTTTCLFRDHRSSGDVHATSQAAIKNARKRL